MSLKPMQSLLRVTQGQAATVKRCHSRVSSNCWDVSPKHMQAHAVTAKLKVVKLICTYKAPALTVKRVSPKHLHSPSSVTFFCNFRFLTVFSEWHTSTPAPSSRHAFNCECSYFKKCRSCCQATAITKHCYQ